jgi:hypothetical protein
MPELSHHGVEDVVIALGQTASGVFRVGEYNKGSVQVPSEVTSSGYSLEVSNDGVTYDALKTSAGVPVGTVNWSAGDVLPLPAELFSCKWAKIVANDTEVAARTFKVCLKG